MDNEQVREWLARNAQEEKDTFNRVTIERLLADSEAYAKLRAEIAGAPVVEWQPIETAPKDGTAIDLWAQSLGLESRDSDEMRVYVEFRVPDAIWFDGAWTNEDGNPLDCLEGFTNIRFSHWTHRPGAPGERKA